MDNNNFDADAQKPQMGTKAFCRGAWDGVPHEYHDTINTLIEAYPAHMQRRTLTTMEMRDLISTVIIMMMVKLEGDALVLQESLDANTAKTEGDNSEGDAGLQQQLPFGSGSTAAASDSVGIDRTTNDDHDPAERPDKPEDN